MVAAAGQGWETAGTVGGGWRQVVCGQNKPGSWLNYREIHWFGKVQFFSLDEPEPTQINELNDFW